MFELEKQRKEDEANRREAEKLAREAGFLRVLPGEPAIGGRYSALSHFGMAPAAYVLWTKHMKYNPANPLWHNRDRLSSSQPDTTGTIQRDTAATPPSESETGPAAVLAEVPGSEPVPDSGAETPAGADVPAGGLPAELPELATDAEPRSSAPAVPDHTLAVESGLPAPVASLT
mgnify:CR=1 FL=1